MKILFRQNRLFVFGFIALGTWARAADIRSVASGNWNTAGTWRNQTTGLPQVPTSADDVMIQIGHQVTLDSPGGLANSLMITGSNPSTGAGSRLIFSRTPAAVYALTLGAGDVNVAAGGVLDMGTEASPIPSGTTAQMILASNAVNKGLSIDTNGSFSSRGADKSPVAVALADLSVGALTLTVPAADTVMWAVGDTITIGQTDYVTPWENQTEEKGITSLTPSGGNVLVGWSGGLSFHHTAAYGIRVANLTRNVVIKSAAASTIPGDSGYIYNGSTLAGGFRAVQTEFYRLGEDSWYPHVGIRFDGGDGVISSSTLHDGMGMVFNGASGGQFTHNVFYKNIGGNFWRTFQKVPSGKYIAFNDFIFASDGDGASGSDMGGNIYRDNFAYSNNGNGIGAWYETGGHGNVYEGNRAYCNAGSGMGATDPNGDIATSNVSFNNNGAGFGYWNSVSSVFSGNTAWGNSDDGISFDGGGSDLVIGGNVSHANGGSGISVDGGGFYFANLNYNNSWAGIRVQQRASYVFQDSSEGYTPAGTSSPNLYAGTLFEKGGAGNTSLLLKNCRFLGGWNFSSSGMPAGFSILSINQDFSTGTARVYGTPTLASGQDLTLDYNQPVYHATATVPVLYHGTGHTATVTGLVDAAAVSQVVLIKWDADANLWRVEGSSTPAFGTIAAAGGSLTTSQFRVSLTVSGTPQLGDRLAFSLLSSSKDSGRQKKLQFSSTDFNFGQMASYGLTVAPGASLTLRGGGVSNSTTTVGLLNPATDTPYNFISSGTLTMAKVTVDSMTAVGLRLTGSGGVAMSSVTFNNIGAGGGGAYITATNLTSSATFYNLVFNDNPNRTPYGVKVVSPDSNLNWYIKTFSGSRSGYARCLDPNFRILWGDTAAPDNPTGVSAVTGSSEGQIHLSWTAPRDNESMGPVSTSTLRNGHYLLFRSTSSAARNAAAPSQAQISLSTTVTLGVAGSYTDTVPMVGTVYYYKLWAADKLNNASSGVAVSTTSLRLTPQPAPNFAARVVGGTTVSLIWLAPPEPSAAYLGSYLLRFSTISFSGPWDPATVSLPGSATSYSHLNRDFNTTYYYTLFTIDTGGGAGGTSAPASALARTLDVVSPELTDLSVGGRMVGVSTGAVATVTFSKTMDAASVAAAVTWRCVRDHLGNSTSTVVATTPGGSGTTFTFTPTAPLAGNSVYEIAVATTAVDTYGKHPPVSGILNFRTLMDRTVRNVVLTAGGVLVDVPSGALSADGYLLGVTQSNAQWADATRKLIDATGDPFRAPLSGALVSLVAFDAGGNVQSFPASPVAVTVPFPGVDEKGLVVGSVPPVKAKTLAVYRLDEANHLWIKVPSSVDAAGGRVTAGISRFATIALIGQADEDLTGAYAFPSPFLPSQGSTQVTFTNVGQLSTIRIFSAAGELVRELKSPPDGGEILWDVKNASGRPVATGMYFYEIKCGGSKKTGKIGVVR